MAGACLDYLRNHRKAEVAGIQWSRESSRRQCQKMLGMGAGVGWGGDLQDNYEYCF